MNLLLLIAGSEDSSSRNRVPIHLNTAGVSQVLTGISWPVLNAKESANSAGMSGSLTGLEWWIQPTVGENQFVNPGFENGINNYSIHDSSNGFYGTVEATSVSGEYHSGSGAAKLTSGTTDPVNITRLSQDCVTEPGKKYMLSFWAKGDGINMPHFFMYDRTTDDNITPNPVPLAGISTEWQKFTYTFTAGVGCTLARSVLYAPYVVGGVVFYDDLFFGEVLATPIDTYDNENSVGVGSTVTDILWNLGPTEINAYENANSSSIDENITGIAWEVEQPNIWADYNPGFESDFANWVKNDSTNGNHGTASITSVEGEHYSGSKAAKLTADATTKYTTDPWLHRDTVLQPSTNYRLTFWSRGDGTNAGMFFIHDKTTNTYITPSDVSTGNATTTWQKVTYDFTTPAGASNVRIFLESSGNIGSVVWFDECSLSLR